MLRPTLAEMLLGLRRTIVETLAPELTSPYAQGQAATASNVIAYVTASLEAAPSYDRFETEDLSNIFIAIHNGAAASALSDEALKSQLDAGFKAATQSSPDRASMEAAMSELVAA